VAVEGAPSMNVHEIWQGKVNRWIDESLCELKSKHVNSFFPNLTIKTSNKIIHNKIASMKFSVGLALAASIAATATANAIDEIGRERFLRQEVDVDVQGHRELWGSGWSWTNILCK
jgi:hypothetical protein